MDFSKFDEQINSEQLAKDIKEAAANQTDFPEVPKGTYIVKVEKLEIGETGPNSAGGAGRPMLKGQFRIVEGEFEKQCLFINRVLFGTKNDANMIASAVGFLNKLEPSEDVGPVVFVNYSQFADLVLDIMEDIDGVLEYEVDYDPKAFNSVSIKDVFEV